MFNIVTDIELNIGAMSVIEFIIQGFKPISLSEMDSVKLMNRIDTKYVCSIESVPLLLFDIIHSYKVLEISENRIMPYETIYYDTSDFKMFIDHQNGKLNRYKVRHREYLNTGVNFLEIKFKNNKGRTIKSRISSDCQLSRAESEFISKSSPFVASDLEPKLWNSFKRITLVGEDERITIDFTLCFNNGNGHSAEYYNLGVIEVKQSKYNSSSVIKQTLRNHRIFPSGFSKYCIGTASLYNHLKINRFKSKLLSINKLTA